MVNGSVGRAREVMPRLPREAERRAGEVGRKSYSELLAIKENARRSMLLHEDEATELPESKGTELSEGEGMEEREECEQRRKEDSVAAKRHYRKKIDDEDEKEEDGGGEGRRRAGPAEGGRRRWRAGLASGGRSRTRKDSPSTNTNTKPARNKMPANVSSAPPPPVPGSAQKRPRAGCRLGARCLGCPAPECGHCSCCLDKPSRGGANRLKQRCVERKCRDV